MKEIIIIIVILALIFGGAIYVQNYLEESSKYLISRLENLKEMIKNKDENMKEEVNDIYNKWKKTDEKWAVVVLHDELDLIDESLIKMKSGVEEGDFDDSMRELETSIFLLNHINEKEKTSIKNIF